jgi:hypothetical protein
MVTSCAVTPTTMYLLLTKRQIRIKFGHRLAYFKRFIDDIIGVWLTDASVVNHEEDQECLAFQEELNNFDHLKWTVTALKKKYVFLNLNIALGVDGKFSFKTFQKDLNLHLYIPAASAHSPDTLNGIIYGNLQRYWRHNTRHEDYVRMVQSFGSHLINTYNDIKTITTHLKDAAKTITKKESRHSIIA